VHAVTEDRPYKLSLSAGIAHYDPQKPRSLDELMAEADERMYREKEGKQRD
jgi:GGDEF domain-containing protein